MEAMVFTTLIFLGIQKSLNTPLYRKDLKRYAGSVRVFGDDLIVPKDNVTSVVGSLEHFGARVGASKSFWTGKFRESCGGVYFNGHDVSFDRVRQVFPTQRQDVSEVISLVSLRTRLYKSGYWSTVRWIDGILGKLLTHYPTVGPHSSLLGRVSFLAEDAKSFSGCRLHPSLQTPVVKGFVVEAKPPRDNLDGTGALLKCLLKLDMSGSLRGKVPCHLSSMPDDGENRRSAPLRERSPMVSSNHLERSGRSKSLSMKLGWRSPL